MLKKLVSFTAVISFGFVIIAILLEYFATVDTDCRMAEAGSEQFLKFAEGNKSAFILGFTGEVGKEVVEATVESQIFSKLVLFGRRKVDSYNDVEKYKNVEQKVIDFDKLEDFAEEFKGFDVGYSCLGTTRGKSGADGFYKVDHDYVVNTAKLAKDGGCKQFHLVSSTGANKNSSFLYPRTKGEVEEELKSMAFHNLYIYRPSMLLCDRAESRPMEKVAKVFIKPITWAFPTAISIPTSTVAKAMIKQTITPNETPVLILENKAIHSLCK